MIVILIPGLLYGNIYTLAWGNMTCVLWPLFISHTSDFSYHPGLLWPAPAAELKSIKHPNILLNMSGLCHAAASSNASRVIMVITQASEARPEARRGRGQPWELEAAEEGLVGGQGKGRRLSLRHAVKHLHHIGGRGVAVDIPSDLSTSAIRLLMLDDDKFKQLEYLSHNACPHTGTKVFVVVKQQNYILTLFLDIIWTEWSPHSKMVVGLIPAVGLRWSLHLTGFVWWTEIRQKSYIPSFYPKAGWKIQEKLPFNHRFGFISVFFISLNFQFFLLVLICQSAQGLLRSF